MPTLTIKVAPQGAGFGRNGVYLWLSIFGIA